MSEETSYIPGMCNINAKEVAYRKKAMWLGVAASLIVLVGALIAPIPWWVGCAMLFIPVFIAAIGYLQVKNRFCVSYGSSGIQNADENGDEAIKVATTEAIRADKRKARRMNLQALGLSFLVLVIAGPILYFA